LIYKKENKNRALRVVRSKPKATSSNEFWGIDMTKVLTPTGWVYITIVLDWYTKKVVAIIQVFKVNLVIGYQL